MRITRIESQKKNRGRKSLYAGDEFVVGVGAETLLRAGVRRGDELSEEQLEDLRRMEDMQAARRAALGYLSRRPRTEKEVRDRLRGREFSDAEIGETIRQLKLANLLNDEEFAHMFVRNALSRRPVGPLRMKQKMMLLGLDKRLVESTIMELCTTETQTTSARDAAEKFLARHQARRQDPLKLRKGLVDHLTRRGFPWGIVQPLVKDILHPSSTTKEKQ